MTPTLAVEQAKGFGLWMQPAVMFGRGSEVVDLARTSLSSRLSWLRIAKRPE